DATEPLERRRGGGRVEREHRDGCSAYQRSKRSGMMLVHQMTPIASADRLNAVASACAGSRSATASVGSTAQTSAAYRYAFVAMPSSSGKRGAAANAAAAA